MSGRLRKVKCKCRMSRRKSKKKKKRKGERRRRPRGTWTGGLLHPPSARSEPVQGGPRQPMCRRVRARESVWCEADVAAPDLSRRRGIMRGDQEERAHGTYGSRRFVIFVKKRGSCTAWDPRCFTTTQGEAQLSVGCVARSDWCGGSQRESTVSLRPW